MDGVGAIHGAIKQILLPPDCHARKGFKNRDEPISTSYLTEDYFARPTAVKKTAGFYQFKFLHV